MVSVSSPWVLQGCRVMVCEQGWGLELVEGFGYSGRCRMKVAAAPLLSRSLASCVELVGENRASPGTWYQENDRERGV